MEEIIIQEANIDDLEKLMNWRMEVLETVFNHPEKSIMNQLYQNNLEYYKTSIPTGNHIAVFANINNQTVGCGGICFYQEMPSPDNLTGNCSYLMNIYTRKKFRKRGIASQIIKFLIQKARDKNISKIYLESTKSALQLYKQLDFVEMKDYLKLNT